jgi:hypothetical protein
MLTKRRLAGALLVLVGGLAVGVAVLRVPVTLVAVLAAALLAASTGYGKSDAP